MPKKSDELFSIYRIFQNYIENVQYVLDPSTLGGSAKTDDSMSFTFKITILEELCNGAMS